MTDLVDEHDPRVKLLLPLRQEEELPLDLIAFHVGHANATPFAFTICLLYNRRSVDPHHSGRKPVWVDFKIVLLQGLGWGCDGGGRMGWELGGKRGAKAGVRERWSAVVYEGGCSAVLTRTGLLKRDGFLGRDVGMRHGWACSREDSAPYIHRAVPFDPVPLKDHLTILPILSLRDSALCTVFFEYVSSLHGSQGNS